MTNQSATDCLNSIRAITKGVSNVSLTEDTSTDVKTLQTCIAYLNVVVKAFGCSTILDTSTDVLSAMAILTRQFHAIMNAVA